MDGCDAGWQSRQLVSWQHSRLLLIVWLSCRRHHLNELAEAKRPYTAVYKAKEIHVVTQIQKSDISS